jgi:hypothetical protein
MSVQKPLKTKIRLYNSNFIPIDYRKATLKHLFWYCTSVSLSGLRGLAARISVKKPVKTMVASGRSVPIRCTDFGFSFRRFVV